MEVHCRFERRSRLREFASKTVPGEAAHGIKTMIVMREWDEQYSMKIYIHNQSHTCCKHVHVRCEAYYGGCVECPQRGKLKPYITTSGFLFREVKEVIAKIVGLTLEPGLAR